MMTLLIKRSLKPTLCLIAIALTFGISACTSTPKTLYTELGGQAKIEEISDNFVDQIAYNKHIVKYFENSNIDRFREKISEHLCMVTNGPCEYTGDNMVDVHTGMNINENHFNLVVDLLINAMTKANIPHSTQNKVLAELAPLRSEIAFL